MDRKDFRFAHTLRVRWAEIDAQGIVFNGHYLTWFDIGITEYWRAIGVPYPAVTERWGTDLFVVKAGIEYYGPAHYDDVVDVCVRAVRIGSSSLQFAIGIYRGGQHLISGELIYVNADPATRKASPVPAALRAIIDGYESGARGG
ncbi:MAG: acyl-CoA thioesterase [Betaproteobacteria bacterium]|nr:acyl-CoA thioesterase [Betaproteobacteria bacterium]